MNVQWIDKVTGQEISGPEESTQAKQAAQGVPSPSEDTKEDSQTEEDLDNG